MGKAAPSRRLPRRLAPSAGALALAFALASAAGVARAQSPAEGQLAGVVRTAHFEIRFREGSHAEASADRVAAAVEGYLAGILRELGVPKFPHVIRLFLYDDVPELQRVTGVPAAGYSTPLES